MNQIRSQLRSLIATRKKSPHQIQAARERRRIRRLGALLRPFARFAYRRHRSPVVAITGSVGKSTTTAFTAMVLSSTFKVVRPHGNYNDYTGVPTTILGVRRIRTVFHYLREFPRIVFRTFVKQPFRADYFVLEVGADGIDSQLTLFTPSVTVVTAIAAAHVEKFGSIEGIIREKGQLVRALPKTGHAVLCYDDANVRQMARLNRGTTIFYGFSSAADVWMEEPNREGGGLRTTLHDAEGAIPLYFPRLFNHYHLLGVLAAWCVGRIAGMTREQLATAVQKLAPLRGRGRPIEGPRGTVIYDDAFNANPASMRAALETFQAAASDRRRVIILGDMYELGAETDRFHREVGQQAAAVADVLIGVGEHAHTYVTEFMAIRPSAPAYHSRDIGEAFEVVRRELQPGDAVLLKGSHGVELQKLIPRIRSLS